MRSYLNYLKIRKYLFTYHRLGINTYLYEFELCFTVVVTSQNRVWFFDWMWKFNLFYEQWYQIYHCLTPGSTPILRLKSRGECNILTWWWRHMGESSRHCKLLMMMRLALEGSISKSLHQNFTKLDISVQNTTLNENMYHFSI